MGAYRRNLNPHGAQLHARAALGGKGDVLHLRLHSLLDATIQHIRPLKARREKEAGMVDCDIKFRDVSMQYALWLKCLVY